MLDKEVFKKQIQKLVNLYPQWRIDITNKKIVFTWYEQFKKYEDKTFMKAIQKYIDTEKYSPTVAGIKGKIKKNQEITTANQQARKNAEETLDWLKEMEAYYDNG